MKYIDPRLHNLLFSICIVGIAVMFGFIVRSLFITNQPVSSEAWGLFALCCGGVGLKVAPNSRTRTARPRANKERRVPLQDEAGEANSE